MESNWITAAMRLAFPIMKIGYPAEKWPADPNAPRPLTEQEKIEIFCWGFTISKYNFPVDPHAPKKATRPSGFGGWRHPDGKMEYWGTHGPAPGYKIYSSDLLPRNFIGMVPDRVDGLPLTTEAFEKSIEEWRQACDKAAKEPFNPAIYGAAIDKAIMDPTAAAFALDALSDKIGVTAAVKAMQSAVKEFKSAQGPMAQAAHNFGNEIFVQKGLGKSKLFTQEPGILKRNHLKKKEQIQALELENALLKNQVRQLTAARNRLADQVSEQIGQTMLNKFSDFQKFQLMPGDCYPAQGVVVYAVHDDLGNVIAWHTAGSWWTRHSLGTGPARQVTEAHIKWYRKIS